MEKSAWQKGELSSFCMEFSLLLGAGMPAEACFSILAENEPIGRKKELLNKLYEKADIGKSLYEVMADSGVFPDYMLKMIMVGEETGSLEATFHSLSVYYGNKDRLIESLKSSVVSPVVLLVVMIAVIVVLLVEILPIFQSVFTQLGGTLPAFSLLFLEIGIFLKEFWVIFAVIGAAIVIFALSVIFSESMNKKFSGFLMNLFYKTKTGMLYAQSHFASALYMAVSSGQDLDRSLELSELFCSKTPIAESVSKCRIEVNSGEAFAESVKNNSLLNPMYCRMLSVGIKTGNLDSVLSEISKRMADETEYEMAKTISYIEPIIVIVLSVIVGVLLLSVMLPLTGILSVF